MRMKDCPTTPRRIRDHRPHLVPVPPRPVQDIGLDMHRHYEELKGTTFTSLPTIKPSVASVLSICLSGLWNVHPSLENPASSADHRHCARVRRPGGFTFLTSYGYLILFLCMQYFFFASARPAISLRTLASKCPPPRTLPPRGQPPPGGARAASSSEFVAAMEVGQQRTGSYQEAVAEAGASPKREGLQVNPADSEEPQPLQMPGSGTEVQSPSRQKAAGFTCYTPTPDSEDEGGQGEEAAPLETEGVHALVPEAERDDSPGSGSEAASEQSSQVGIQEPADGGPSTEGVRPTEHPEVQTNEAFIASKDVSDEVLRGEDAKVSSLFTRSVTSAETGDKLSVHSATSEQIGARDIREMLEKNQESMVVMELDQDGTYELKEIQRSDILDYVSEEAYSRSAGMAKLSASAGISIPKDALRYMSPGDLRRLDRAFSLSDEPIVLVRRNALLLHLVSLRVIIFADRCLFMLPDGADGIVALIRRRLCDPFPGSEKLTFQSRCLELVLHTMSVMLYEEVQRYDASIRATLGRLRSRDHRLTEDLEVLRQQKNRLGETQATLTRLRTLLAETLDEEEEERGITWAILLSIIPAPLRAGSDPQLTRKAAHFLEREGTAVEVLLEGAVQDINKSTNSINLLETYIASTENLIELRLDTARNQLLLVSAVLSLVSVALSVPMITAGFMGMNVVNNIEDEEGWFQGTIAMSMVLALVIFLLLLWYLVRNGIFRI